MAADPAGGDASEALESFGEGEFVVVANLMDHAGAPFVLGEKFRP